MNIMSAETMLQANGGKYRYKCTRCGSKTRSVVGMILHIATYHLGNASWRKI